jgi:hypothetical protein
MRPPSGVALLTCRCTSVISHALTAVCESRHVKYKTMTARTVGEKVRPLFSCFKSLIFGETYF